MDKKTGGVNEEKFLEGGRMNWGFRGERKKQRIERRETKKKERERGGGDFRRRYKETERGT